MPIKIYHPDHGFVLTNDNAEIAGLLAKGGKVIVKNKEAEITTPPKHEEDEPKAKKETDSKDSHKWSSKN